jgi:4-hydroxybenzoate polyprenyltransferase
MNRWVVYQRERFPLVAHTPLVAAFSGSAVCISSLLRGQVVVPPAERLLVAFLTALLFFLQLRITDEFKDAEDDARYRPYRPVPRGLVTLGELRIIGIGAAAIQLALALWLEPRLVGLLVLAWGYLALMTREFFVPEWLKAHPVIYMTSHMVIVPILDLYATACDWLVAGLRWPPNGLVWFLLVSFFNGIVIEIGRKMRAPADEEPGVDTYTRLWGSGRAVAAWIAALAVTAACGIVVCWQVGTGAIGAAVLAAMVAGCVAAGIVFLRRPATSAAKRLELLSGIWTLIVYLSLGAVPLALAVWRSSP